MLIQLTVRSVNFRNVTAYTGAFESLEIHKLRPNQSTGAIPVLDGQTEFIYTGGDGRDTFYTVTETVNSVVNAAGGVAGTAPNYGVAAANVTVLEYGDGLYHKTTLTMDSYTEAIASAALAVGQAVYTFPTGGIIIHGGTLDMTIAGATSVATPDIGIGTVIGTGAVAVLGGTATFEDIMDGAAGTAISASGGQTVRVFKAMGDATTFDGHTTPIPVFLNFAFLWIVTEALTINPCVITFNWTFLGDV